MHAILTPRIDIVYVSLLLAHCIDSCTGIISEAVVEPSAPPAFQDNESAPVDGTKYKVVPHDEEEVYVGGMPIHVGVDMTISWVYSHQPPPADYLSRREGRRSCHALA